MFSHIFKGGFLTPFGSHPPNFSVDINNYIYIYNYIYMMMYILIISKPLSRSDWIQSYFSWFVRPPRSRLNSKSWISSLDKTRPNEVHISMDQLNYLQMVCKDHQICPQCDHSAEITTIHSITRNFARSRHLRVESHMQRWATENECYYQGQGRCLVSSRVFSCCAIRSHQYVSTGWRPASWRLSLTSCNVVWTVPFWEQGMKHRGSSKASWFTQHQRSSACFIGRYGWYCICWYDLEAEHSQGLSSNSAENEARVASARAEELEPVKDRCVSFA